MDPLDSHRLALLTVAEMAQADRSAIAAGIPGATLMDNAGSAVAAAAARHAPEGASVLVLCGPGNNGGDGFVAARLLRERGRRVTVALVGDRAALRGDAGGAAAGWPEAVVAPASVDPSAHAVIVDALYGAGLNRPVTGPAAALIEAVNASGRPVIAVDVPSGLSGDTGRAEGPVVAARETVTFFRLKPGHLLLPGRLLCGRVTLADIGIAPGTAFAGGVPSAFRNDPELWRALLPRHDAGTHKFRRGAVLALAGGLAGVGAPRLAARAALRIGAGLVTVACRPEALAAHASRGPDAVMQRPVASLAALEAMLADRRLSAVIAGPALGLDGQARDAVMAVLRAAVPAVLDADALTLLAAAPERLGRHCERRGAPCVLTPHEGEFVRLFGRDLAQTGSKLDAARDAARSSEAVVVYKGADTVIAAPDGRAAINATGSAALATAGSGDTLGGLIAGLLAQGMPAFEAACAAVWIHGRAGEALGMGLIADDLADAVPPLLAGLLAEVDPAPEGGAMPGQLPE